MTKPALKLVKNKKKSTTNQEPKANRKQSKIPSILTPAEQAEAARFRALTKQRAARQAKVRRIVAKLIELDNRTPNAA